jgi:hypothetical protein
VVITMLVIRASAGVAAPISESNPNATAQLGWRSKAHSSMIFSVFIPPTVTEL